MITVGQDEDNMVFCESCQKKMRAALQQLAVFRIIVILLLLLLIIIIMQIMIVMIIMIVIIHLIIDLSIGYACIMPAGGV